MISSFSRPANACSLKRDETVIFFNTYGYFNDNSGGIGFSPDTSDTPQEAVTLSIHGWILKKREQSLWRSLARKLFAKISDFPTAGPEYEILIERLHYFFADNQQKKNLTIQIGDKLFNLPSSQKDGHFFAEITIDKDTLGVLSQTNWLNYGIHEGHPHSSAFKGQCSIIPAQGISIISDIDDTIKITNVLNEKEKLKNILLRPFKATVGTSKAYRKWESNGARFHYVSGSPWQLYPSLKDEMKDAGFPEGSFHLREKKISLSSFITSDEYNGLEHKLDVIREIINTYPKRKFVLVGDCSEQDP